MAIDPQALQIFSMVLQGNRQEEESAKQRGHEQTMFKLSTAQRNLENQLNNQAQMFAEDSNRLFNLKNQLSEAGVDVEEFGVESDAKDLFADTEQNLNERLSSLESLTEETGSQINKLFDVKASIVRGSDYGRSLQASFNEDMTINIDSEFGELSNIKDDEVLLRSLEEKGISSIGDTASEKSAFVRGLRGVLSDTTGLMQEESLKRQEIDRQAEAESRILRNNALRISNATQAYAYADQLEGNFTELISPSLHAIATEEDPEKRQEDFDVLLAQTEALAPSIADTIKNISGQDNEFTRKVAALIPEYAIRNVQGMLSNPKATISSIRASMNVIKAEIANNDGVNSIEDVIRENLVSSQDIANVMSFVANRALSPSTASGFAVLEEAINKLDAADAIRNSSSFVRGMERAGEIRANKTFTNYGEEFMKYQPVRTETNEESNESYDSQGGYRSIIAPNRFSAQSFSKNVEMSDDVIESGINSVSEVREAYRVLTEISRKLNSSRTSADQKNELSTRYSKILDMMEKTHLGRALSNNLRETQNRNN